MSKGFLTLGINTDKDQIKYAYGLALSIKACDPEAEFCLVVDAGQSDNVPSKYYHAFDYITELPFGNTGHADGFHGSNLWQLIHCTPFEETIYLDYDTLVNNVNLDLLWEQFANHGIAIPATARSYRNTPINKNAMFEFEKQYEIPALFNSLIYFDRGAAEAIEWFKMADPIFQNWRDVYNELFKEKKPTTFNKNILANIVTKLLDVEQEISINILNFYDLHTKSQWLWHPDVPDDWTSMLNYWYTDSQNLIVENSVISNGIIHYRDEKFLTEEVLNVLRTKADISSRRKAAS